MATTQAKFTASGNARASQGEVEYRTDKMITADDKKKGEKLKLAVFFLLSYFAIGWIAFMFVFESFSFTNATYFLMVTLTVRRRCPCRFAQHTTSRP